MVQYFKWLRRFIKNISDENEDRIYIFDAKYRISILEAKNERVVLDEYDDYNKFK